MSSGPYEACTRDLSACTKEAAVEGPGRTGRLVACAALILFLAFTSLASAPDTDIKVLATGLGAGIVLDATFGQGLSGARPRGGTRSLELVDAALPPSTASFPQLNSPGCLHSEPARAHAAAQRLWEPKWRVEGASANSRS